MKFIYLLCFIIVIVVVVVVIVLIILHYFLHYLYGNDDNSNNRLKYLYLHLQTVFNLIKRKNMIPSLPLIMMNVYIGYDIINL